ncbi:hypothetical protein C8Q77DRAFT_710325 [Trametes polyzona]|nr:hypothetical protein C8Q77DRAFT_710325 [Trametes polyzona]
MCCQVSRWCAYITGYKVLVSRTPGHCARPCVQSRHSDPSSSLCLLVIARLVCSNDEQACTASEHIDPRQHAYCIVCRASMSRRFSWHSRARESRVLLCSRPSTPRAPLPPAWRKRAVARRMLPLSAGGNQAGDPLHVGQGASTPARFSDNPGFHPFAVRRSVQDAGGRTPLASRAPLGTPPGFHHVAGRPSALRVRWRPFACRIRLLRVC